VVPPQRRQRLTGTQAARRGPPQRQLGPEEPALSLALIGGLGLRRDAAATVDVGGGASILAPRLLELGFADVTVVDISARALARARERPRRRPTGSLERDLSVWRPERRYPLLA
jgi:2-polyprenyl-3-methyl-5-hydroxy-6-metoxy-1,4-benzoquinol methylase